MPSELRERPSSMPNRRGGLGQHETALSALFAANLTHIPSPAKRTTRKRLLKYAESVTHTAKVRWSLF